MKHTFSTAAALIATFSLGLADSIPTCGAGNNCPASAPCCSEYGQCGVGAYCLGGCDPKYSFDLQSCVAEPVCQSGNFQLNSLNDVMANTEYLGDPSSTNWVSSGQPAIYNNALLLTMAQSTVGTLLSSTHYVWYGKISATLTTSQGQGVVTAFIMMSDVKDEIDFEFVGADINSAQSNYYWQGVTDYDNELSLNTSDTRLNTHTYTFDWTPDTLTWLIDGNPMRTLNRADTWNSTSQTYHYPQTPARIELSLWPAGLPSNGNGTITWAGGLIDWNSPYMSSQGYYYAVVNDVNVECYNPPSGWSNNFGNSAYYYLNTAGTNNTVAIGNNNTILSSFLASGDNPSYNPYAKPSGTSSVAQPTLTDIPQSVPGISGGGVRGSDGGSGTGSGSSSGSGSDGGSSSGGQGSSGSSGSSGGGSTGFSQGTSSTGTSEGSTLVAGSAVALLGFFVAALVL